MSIQHLCYGIFHLILYLFHDINYFSYVSKLLIFISPYNKLYISFHVQMYLC